MNNLKKKKCFLFDYDNTLILNGKPMNYALETFNKLKELNKHIYIISNNNRFSIDYLFNELKYSNFNISKINIITPLLLIKKFLKKKNYNRIFIWGTKLSKTFFIENNFKIDNETPEIIIVLYNNIFNYDDLCHLCNLVKTTPYIIGNIDPIYPDKNKILPDTGCLWKYIEYCTKNLPIKIFGKPYPFMISNIINKYKKEENIFIGVSEITDKKLGNNCNIDFILVNKNKGDINDLKCLYNKLL